jgi:DNA repair exonuclease SbcCD ATPase subunit
MKIISLVAENIKKIRAVEIRPAGPVVMITGRNGQGKTSVLDSMWFALGGKKAVQECPIRNGQKKGKAEVTLAEFDKDERIILGTKEDKVLVTRSFTESNSYLKIEPIGIEGKKHKELLSPQEILDKVFNATTFDPLSFMSSDARRQVEILIGLLNLPKDPRAIDSQVEAIKAIRAVENRELKRLETMASPVPEKVREVEVSQLMATLDKYQSENSAIDKDLAEENALRSGAETMEFEISNMEKEITKKREKIKEMIRRAELLAGNAGVKIDTDGIKRDIATASETNKKALAYAAWANTKEALVVQQRKVDGLNHDIMKLEEEKKEMLSGASLPLPGLEIQASGVFFQGNPLAQASDAEQLKISLAIAMALNPKLRVVRVKNGSLLDSASLAVINKMAKDNDFDVWIEKVDESGKIGVYIEDGKVSALDGVATEKEVADEKAV